jgi:carbon-monoxide dehydrogenase medium subunit
MRSGRLSPASVVDLKRIAGISSVRREGESFMIGAATPCASLKADADLVASWPGVVEAANLIGSVQVRNRATMAGNLCNASPAADSVPALVAAGASCVVAGPSGTREVPVEAIPLSPGRTSLAPGEFVVGIRLPARAKGGADAYLRSIPRTEMDIAVVGAAANLQFDDEGTCTSARIALGAVAPTVVLVEAAGAALVGTKLDAAALDAMVEAVKAACSPIDDKRGTISYRKAMAGVLAKRTVQIAAERAGVKA